MSIKVFGASDDLIEVEGDIEEEFSHLDDTAYLCFSDGTILSVEFSRSGIWRIVSIVSGTAAVSIVQAPANDDDNYSDVATIEGDVLWVVYGTQYVSA